MSETSREFWRNPDTYARNEIEVLFGKPAYYSDPRQNAISEQIVRMLEKAGANKTWKVLEVGCNCGRNMAHLLRSYYTNIEGVEINPEAVEHAWVHFPSVASRIRVLDAQSFLAMKPPNSYDLIYTQSILMHIPPEDDYLFKQMTRAASKMLFISEVEVQEGNLMRHKYNRNYRDVFEALGWRQVLHEPNDRREMRAFVR
jgi:predicted TPR repeat methyltransferase